MGESLESCIISCIKDLDLYAWLCFCPRPNSLMTRLRGFYNVNLTHFTTAATQESWHSHPRLGKMGSLGTFIIHFNQPDDDNLPDPVPCCCNFIVIIVDHLGFGVIWLSVLKKVILSVIVGEFLEQVPQSNRSSLCTSHNKSSLLPFQLCYSLMLLISTTFLKENYNSDLLSHGGQWYLVFVITHDLRVGFWVQ